jgi:vacuolar-type H+-ATPase subunit C/Vma6
LRTHRINANAEKGQVDKALQEATVDLFNKVLGTSPDSAKFWATVMTKEIADKFNYQIKYPQI